MLTDEVAVMHRAGDAHADPQQCAVCGLVLSRGIQGRWPTGALVEQVIPRSGGPQRWSRVSTNTRGPVQAPRCVSLHGSTRPRVLAVRTAQPVLTVAMPTTHGRVYPREVIEREAAQLNQYRAGMTGVVGTPTGGRILATCVSHQTKHHHVDAAGVLRCDVEILDTPEGRMVFSALSQGWGCTLVPMGRGTVHDGVVQTDFTLDAINIELTRETD